MNSLSLKCFRLLAVSFCICQLFISQSLGQWSTNPNVNTAVVTDVNQQNSCKIASDGSGGAIITWRDYNSSTNDYDIYAQRINAAGVIQWNNRGVAICTNVLSQLVPQITGDGNGGAIITWVDQRNVKNEVFAQKVNSQGIVQWTADGVSVGTVTDHYQHGSPAIVNDGNGGAIIAFEDWRGDFYNGIRSIRAQRINSSGSILWGIGGVLLDNNGGGGSPKIIKDGNGGAIVAWDVWIGVYPAGNRDVYSQKVNSDGSISWGTGGLVICSTTNEQSFPYLTGDGNGGAIIAWEDYRNGSSSNLYAQKVSAAGAIQWTADGIKVSSSTSKQYNQRLLSNGSGGAFIVWQTGTNGGYVQLLNSSGVNQWASSGVGVCGSCSYPQIESDGGTGALITWNDMTTDVLAQHLNVTGTLLWSLPGKYICSASGSQYEPQLVSDGNGGAVIVWDDYRNTATTSTDIYAQQINGNGSLGITTGLRDISGSLPGSFSLDQNHPNPFNPETTINYTVNSSESVSLRVLNSEGKEVATLVNRKMEPGNYSVRFNATGLPAGVYHYTMKAGIEKQTRSMILSK